MDLGPVQERREGELFCSLTLNALERTGHWSIAKERARCSVPGPNSCDALGQRLHGSLRWFGALGEGPPGWWKTAAPATATTQHWGAERWSR